MNSFLTLTTMLLCAGMCKAGNLAIIGCGPTGLLQAYELIEAGLDGSEIDIFESGPKCASLVTTLEHNAGVGGATDQVDVGTSVIVAHRYTKESIGLPPFSHGGTKLLEKARGLVDNIDREVFNRASEILSTGGGKVNRQTDRHTTLHSTPVATPFDTNFPLEYNGLGQMGAPYGEILHELGIEMIPLATSSITWDPVTKTYASPPFPAITNYSDPLEIAQLIQEAIVGMNIFEGVLTQTVGIQGVYSSGFCLPGETFQEWITRVNLPVFGDFTAAQMDINTNASPAKNQPCSVVLRACSFIMMDLCRVLFQRLQVFQTGDPYVDYILTQVDDFSYYIPKGGYQAVIDALSGDAENKGVTIRLNSEVTDLQYDDGKVEVTYLKDQNKVKTKKYKVVISAVRPEEATFFQHYPAVDNLFEKARDNTMFGNLASLAFSVENGTEAGIPPLLDPFNLSRIADPVALSPFPVYLGFGTATFDVPNCVPWVYLKDKAGVEVYTNYAFRDPNTPEETCLQIMRNFSASANIVIENELGNAVHDWPSIVSPTEEGNGWYEQMDLQQGVGNLFLANDIFSGGGVNLISRYLRDTRDDLVASLTALGCEFSPSSPTSAASY